MVSFAGGGSAAGDRSTAPQSLPRPSKSTLSPLAPPFSFNPTANHFNPVQNPNSCSSVSFPHENSSYSVSEGSIPTSTQRVNSRIQISEPVSKKKAIDTTHRIAKEGSVTQHISSDSSLTASSSLQKGLSCTNPFSSESCKIVDSKYSCDNYMTPPDSSTALPRACYFPPKAIPSFQPASCTTSSYLQNNASFTFKEQYNINPNYVDNFQLMNNRTVPYTGSKQGCYEVSGTNNMKKYFDVSMDQASSGLESDISKTAAHSVQVNSGMSSKCVDSHNDFMPDCGLDGAGHSISYDSSRTLDQTVDSPCWKGALVSQQSPFSSSAQELHINIESGANLSSGLDKCYEPLPVTEKIGSLRYSSIESSSALSTTSQTCEDNGKIHLDCIRKMQHSGICREQNVEVRSGEERESDSKNNEVVLLCQESVHSSSKPLLAAGFANYKTSYNYTLQDRASEGQPPATSMGSTNDSIELAGSSVDMFKNASLNVCLGTLQYLSEMLLSSDHILGREMKDSDHEVLQSVIANLEAFAMKSNKEYTKGSFWNSGPTGVSHDGRQERNTNISCEAKEKFAFSYASSYTNNDQDAVEVYQAIQEKMYCEQEEKLQSLVYKKLWFDAEAALRTMKYELQLAHTKLETANNVYQLEGNAPRPLLLGRPNFVHNYENDNVLMAKQHASVKEILDRPSSDKDVNTSTMSQLNILKGKDASSSDQKMMIVPTEMWFSDNNFNRTHGPATKISPAKIAITGKGMHFRN